MPKQLTGKTATISNGHLSYEVHNANSEFVPVLATLLQEQLGISPVSLPGISASEVALKMELNGIELDIGWDVWSGVYVMARCEQGDLLVRRLASYLDDELEKPIYRKFLIL